MQGIGQRELGRGTIRGRSVAGKLAIFVGRIVVTPRLHQQISTRLALHRRRLDSDRKLFQFRVSRIGFRRSRHVVVDIPQRLGGFRALP